MTTLYTHPPFPKHLWGALFIFIPLYFNPLSRWQYEPDKVGLLLMLTALLFGWSWWKGAFPSVGLNRVERWLGIYLLVGLLALVTSIMPHWSLWGDPAWRNGLLLTLTGAGIFILARRQFVTPKRREWAINIILLTSGFVSVGGILQYFGFNLFAYEHNPIYRASGSLAHANLLAAYLAMIIPLTPYRLLTISASKSLNSSLITVGSVYAPHHSSLKPFNFQLLTFNSLLLSLQLWCLILTYSRAGWLSATAGILVFLGSHLWNRGQRRAAGLLVGSLAAGLVLLLSLNLLPPLPSTAPHALQTLAGMLRQDGATAQIRLLGWDATIQAISQRPFLGYGQATFRPVLEWFLPPQLAPFGGAAALGGRPHNRYLEIIFETGFFGFIAYSGVLISLFMDSKSKPALLLDGRSGLRPYPQNLMNATKQNKPFNFQLLTFNAILIANLVNNLFSFDCAATLMLFWVFAGIAHAEPEIKSAPKPHPHLGLAVAAGGIILMLWMAVPDMLAYISEMFCQKSLDCQPEILLQAASDYGPTPEIFLMMLGDDYAQKASETKQASSWQAGTATYDRLLLLSPQVAEYWQRRGQYYRRWLDAGNGDASEHAIDAYTRAIDLSPQNPDFWLDRGLTYAQSHDFESAESDFEQAQHLLPDYARYYGARSISAMMQGEFEVAQNWQAQALEAQTAWDGWVWRR